MCTLKKYNLTYTQIITYMIDWLIHACSSDKEIKIVDRVTLQKSEQLMNIKKLSKIQKLKL